jgi:hypothetical protein
MGLDLTLLPIDIDCKNFFASHVVLSCERRGDLFEKIKKLPSKKAPKLYSFLAKGKDGEHCYGVMSGEDPYGDPLWCVEALHLKRLWDHVEVEDNWRNRAAWAYLRQLPSNMKVVLFWH